MKTKLLVLVLSVLCVSLAWGEVVFEDDFESYAEGTVSPGPKWSGYNMGASAQAFHEVDVDSLGVARSGSQVYHSYRDAISLNVGGSCVLASDQAFRDPNALGTFIYTGWAYLGSQNTSGDATQMSSKLAFWTRDGADEIGTGVGFKLDGHSNYPRSITYYDGAVSEVVEVPGIPLDSWVKVEQTIDEVAQSWGFVITTQGGTELLSRDGLSFRSTGSFSGRLEKVAVYFQTNNKNDAWNNRVDDITVEFYPAETTRLFEEDFESYAEGTVIPSAQWAGSTMSTASQAVQEVHVDSIAQSGDKLYRCYRDATSLGVSSSSSIRSNVWLRQSDLPGIYIFSAWAYMGNANSQGDATQLSSILNFWAMDGDDDIGASVGFKFDGHYNYPRIVRYYDGDTLVETGALAIPADQWMRVVMIVNEGSNTWSFLITKDDGSLVAGRSNLGLRSDYDRFEKVAVYFQSNNSNDAWNNRVDTIAVDYIGLEALTLNDVSGVYAFPLPHLAEGEMITSADFTAYCNASVGRVDLYGVRYGAEPEVLASDYWAGYFDVDAHLIEKEFFNSSMTTPGWAATQKTIGDASLCNWLNDLYTAGAYGGQYVFVRLSWANPVDYTDASDGWFEPQDGANAPTLTLTVGDRPAEIDPAYAPVTAPIAEQQYYQGVRELYGYAPKWLAETDTTPTFGPDGLPYMRTCEYDYGWPYWKGKNGIVTTIDPCNGQWIKLDFKSAIKAAYPSWDGEYLDFAPFDKRIVWDADGDAYMIIDTERYGAFQLNQNLLLHSQDRCRTWTVYELPFHVFQIEHRDGHNSLDGVPMIIGAMSRTQGETLYLLDVTKNPDGTLTVPSPVMIADRFNCFLHGAGNYTMTIGDNSHIVWSGYDPCDGEVPFYSVSYDRVNKTLSPVTFIGRGGALDGDYADPHVVPVLSSDSQGYLHVVLGGHNSVLKYFRSASPDSTGAWVDMTVSANFDIEGTYAELKCAADNTLHMACRTRESGMTDLVYMRKKPGQNWESAKSILIPFDPRTMYSNYYHKMNIDLQGRMFLNFTVYRSILSSAQFDAYQAKWPGELTGTWDAYSGVQPHDPVILVTEDNGDTWRVATTDDFIVPTTCEQVRDFGLLPRADINQDCYVNLIDLSLLGSGWLECNDPERPDCVE